MEFLNTVMIDDLDSLCNSKNTLEKNQNKNDWLNFMQIFSLKKKFYEGKLGESFIKWSYNFQNYVLCVFLTALRAYQKTINSCKL